MHIQIYLGIFFLLFISIQAFDLRGVEHYLNRRVSVPFRTCRIRRAEIAIVLDSSTSIKPEDFTKNMEFTEKLTQNMVIGPNNVNVGLVQYSSEPHLKFGLKEYQNADSLVGALKRIKQIFGNTNTGGALKMVREQIFPGRPGFPKVGVVITDGKSQDTLLTKEEAEKTKKSGVTLIAVGVGEKVDDQELENIATSPDHIIHVDSYDSLTSDYSTFRRILGKLCDASPAPGPDPECLSKAADITVILDSSTSISPEDFEKDKDFLESLAESFEVSPSKVRMGLVEYSTYAHLKWGLTAHTSKKSLADAFHKVTQIYGDTNTGDALKVAREKVFPKADGGRPDNVPQIGIVITDGNSQESKHTKDQAFLTRQKGITLVAVGVGKKISREELENIATSRQHVVTVDDFDALKEELNRIIGKICTRT